MVWCTSQPEDESDDDGAVPTKKRRSGVAAAGSDSESDYQMDFEDGYGSDLMGDEEDRCACWAERRQEEVLPFE